MGRAAQDDVVVIKKYANRRLYNTETSTYVTLEDLRVMVKEGRSFTVVDAKTGSDLTRQILTQIIFEQENKDHFLLPESFLISLIKFYDDNVRDFVPPYLESSMQALMKNQQQIREGMQGAMSASKGINPLSSFEEIGRQNMELFAQAFQMWSPFGGDASAGKDGPLLAYHVEDDTIDEISLTNVLSVPA